LSKVEQAMTEANRAHIGIKPWGQTSTEQFVTKDSGERERYDSGDGDSIRGKVLTEARGLITGDRNNQYGPPTQDFLRTAEILNAIGYRRPGGGNLQPHDVAVIQIALKLSRVTWTPDKRDSWVDIAGYAGCGYECADEEVTDGDLP
jgi:hypothetical protein